MAKSGQDADESKTIKVKWLGSFNYFLTEVEKKAIKQLDFGWESHFQRLHELTGNGYKVSFTEEKKGRFYAVTAYANQPDHVNAGWSLTQFHGDTKVALAALWYIVAEVHNWESWPAEKQLDFPYNW